MLSGEDHDPALEQALKNKDYIAVKDIINNLMEELKCITEDETETGVQESGARGQRKSETHSKDNMNASKSERKEEIIKQLQVSINSFIHKIF